MKIHILKDSCKDYCGNPRCLFTWLSIGSYAQGTGFTLEEAELIVEAVNSYEELKSTLTTTQAEVARLRRELKILLSIIDEATQDNWDGVLLLSGSTLKTNLDDARAVLGGVE